MPKQEMLAKGLSSEQERIQKERKEKQEEPHNFFSIELKELKDCNSKIRKMEDLIRCALKEILNVQLVLAEQGKGSYASQKKDIESLSSLEKKDYIISHSFPSIYNAPDAPEKIKIIKQFLEKEISLDDMYFKHKTFLDASYVFSSANFYVGYTRNEVYMSITPHTGRQGRLTDLILVSIVKEIEKEAQKMGLQYSTGYQDNRDETLDEQQRKELFKLLNSAA